MKISKKTDYALRALFTLVEHFGRGPIPIRELARRNEELQELARRLEVLAATGPPHGHV